MKRLIIFLALFLAVLAPVAAQHTTPRFGIVPGDDNTGRVLTYKYFLAADKPGADTVNIVPRAWETIVLVSPVVDSLSLNVSSLTYSYAGDKLVFQVINSPGDGHLVKFIGVNFQAGSAGPQIALTSGMRANITFRFDGAAWVETGRIVQ